MTLINFKHKTSFKHPQLLQVYKFHIFIFFSHLTYMTHINYYISYKLLSKTYKPHHFHFNKIYT